MTSSHDTISIAVTEGSAVGHARRTAATLATKLGLSETQIGELAIIVTEAGTNLLQHAGGGELLLRATSVPTCVHVLAIDRGKGMSNVSRCMEDGYSTGGSRGAGLGSMERLADVFDVYSRVDAGTVLYARVEAAADVGAASYAVSGAVSVPYPGEELCGDAWAIDERDGVTRVMVVDGLGHGLLAYEAASAAVDAFTKGLPASAASALRVLHGALSGTRGAAAAIAEIDWGAGQLRFAGVGNVAGSILLEETCRSLPSHNGIVGERSPRIQEFQYEWPRGATLVMHSDGLSGRWSLPSYPGLEVKQPEVLAGVLYRDHCRRRDDATVVVVRRADGAGRS